MVHLDLTKSDRGCEILRIERFDPQGNFLGAWQDAGCNSILVKSVEITALGDTRSLVIRFLSSFIILI